MSTTYVTLLYDQIWCISPFGKITECFPANISLDEDVLRTSWRRLLSSSSEDVFKTSWSRRIYSSKSYAFRRRLQDVLIKTNIIALVICLQDVFKTSCQDFFKMSSRSLAKTTSRHLQDVFKSFSRRLQDIFKMSSRHLQDAFKTFSRRLAKISSRRFQNMWSS